MYYVVFFKTNKCVFEQKKCKHGVINFLYARFLIHPTMADVSNGSLFFPIICVIRSMIVNDNDDEFLLHFEEKNNPYIIMAFTEITNSLYKPFFVCK